MSGKPKIILVDDNLFFCESIKLLIELEGIGEVVAVAENGLEFLDLLNVHTPDLVIVDLEMPVMDGVDATLEALAKKPDLKILILTMTYDTKKLFTLMNAGASGYLLKSSGKKELEDAITNLIDGKKYFSKSQ